MHLKSLEWPNTPKITRIPTKPQNVNNNSNAKVMYAPPRRTQSIKQNNGFAPPRVGQQNMNIKCTCMKDMEGNDNECIHYPPRGNEQLIDQKNNNTNKCPNEK